MSPNATPEYYGYKIGENIVPYINKSIAEFGECYIGEGTHIVGRSDSNWNQGNPYSDNCICWGWARKHDVVLKGAGKDKTILRFADNVQSRYLMGNEAPYVLMLQTNYNESCNNTVISDITWDGNYENNSTTSTIDGIRIRGENTTIKDCKFINFGVGEKLHAETFQIFATTIDKSGKGPNIINNLFGLPGRKSNTKSGFVCENTFIGVGGKNTLVKNNIFNNCLFDSKTQQSPLHAITLMDCSESEVSNNLFDTFQGCCIYMDSWTNDGVEIKNNIANNVWIFFSLTCQSWPNDNQISFNKNFKVHSNNVILANGPTQYQHDVSPGPSHFCGYVYAPEIDKIKHPGFENVIIENNNVTLGCYDNNGFISESGKLICFYGSPVGPEKIKLGENNFTSSKKTIIKSAEPKKKKNIFQIILSLFFKK